MKRIDIEVLAEPYMEEANVLGLEDDALKEVRRSSMGAIDNTTSPARSCGGQTDACTNCNELSRQLGRVAKVCDELPDTITVYKTKDRTAYVSLDGSGGQGAFY